MKTIEEYLRQVTGKDVVYLEDDKDFTLPRFMRSLYKWKLVRILDHKCILIQMQSERLIIKNLIIHLGKLQESLNGNPVLVFDSLNPEQRERLIGHKIPFIVPQSQLYLPFILLDFRKEEIRNHVTYEKFTPSTQLVFLYILYKKENKFHSNEIASYCRLSNMTINRALRELLKLKVIKRIGDAKKNIYYLKSKNNQEMYNICESYLINPLRKKMYVNMENDYLSQKMIPTSEYALSKMSMLSDSSIKQYAIDSETYKDLKKNIVFYEVYVDKPSVIEIEIWKYDPFIVKCEEYETVDLISLSEVLKDCNDERVQIEIEKLLNNALEN